MPTFRFIRTCMAWNKSIPTHCVISAHCHVRRNTLFVTYTKFLCTPRCETCEQSHCICILMGSNMDTRFLKVIPWIDLSLPRKITTSGHIYQRRKSTRFGIQRGGALRQSKLISMKKTDTAMKTYWAVYHRKKFEHITYTAYGWGTLLKVNVR